MGCSSSVPIESGSSSPAGPSREPQGSSSGAASSKRAEAVKRDAVFDDIDEVDEDYVLPVIPKSAEALGRIRSACANLADSIFTGISDEQLEAMNEAKTILNENGPYSLVVVDSIIAHFRTEYTGRGELADRQQALGHHMAALKGMAQEYNVAVVITNQVRPTSHTHSSHALPGRMYR